MVTSSMVKFCPVCKAKYDGGEVFCPTDGGRLSSPSKIDGLAPGAVDDPLVGTTLHGRYLVKKRIGEGGMGIVYAAQHVIIDKRVAIKVLREDFSRRADVVERFRQEAKSASRIQNQHIVDISDFGEVPSGESYFVMEFLEGEDLSSVLKRESTLKPDRAVRIALACTDALGSAHEAGIVHRDMKPENIFLVKRGSIEDFVKIVDFGIAKMNDIETEGAPGRKLTKTGMIFGTPEYMSPEQASGKELDHRVDVYAMGVIIYEMLCGRVPFVGDTFMGILTQQMFEPPPRMAELNPTGVYPADLEAIVMKALAKKPEERFQNMAELGQALRSVSLGQSADRVSNVGTFVGYGEPVKASGRASEVKEVAVTKASSFPPPAYKHVNKGMLFGIGAAAVLALVGVIAVVASSGSKAETVEHASAGAGAAGAPSEPAGAQQLPKQPPVAQADPGSPAPAKILVRIRLKPKTAKLTLRPATVTADCDEDGTCLVSCAAGEPFYYSVEAEGFKPSGEIKHVPLGQGDDPEFGGLKPLASPTKGLPRVGAQGQSLDDLK